MNKLTKSKISLTALAVLALILLISGTYAYWTQELDVINEYSLGFFRTTINEEFTSPDKWVPGIETLKEVMITNSGNIPTAVRVLFRSYWIRTSPVFDNEGNEITPKAGEFMPLMFETSRNTSEYAALLNLNKTSVVLLKSGESMVKSLSLGLDTVENPDDAAGMWLLVSEVPDSEGYYVFYYMGILDANSETPLLLQSVTMNPHINAAITDKTITYEEDANGNRTQKTTVVTNPFGYDSSRYILTIKGTTVQGTADAIRATFTDELDNPAVIEILSEKFALTSEEIAFKSVVKRLYIWEKDARMHYEPIRNGDENWFMSFLRMIPGGRYKDSLTIENGSDKPYDLYMQVIPLEQTDLQDELLELISMEVYYKNNRIYKGKATGRAYSEDVNMQNVVFLGTYVPGDETEINVTIELSKDTGMEYNNILTKIKWKFMVTKQYIPENPVELSPQTSDNNVVLIYIILGTASVMLLFIIGNLR